ncbi:MAG: cell division protein ZapA [Alteromonadaceae bacterium]|jgi:cell division protein ZapA
MSQHHVTVNIANRKLKIACPVGKESALISAASEVSDRIEQSGFKNKATNTPEQSMLMAALNLANELLDLRKQVERERQENQSKIELLQSTIEQAMLPRHNKQA